MTPAQASAVLRRMAAKIENSKSPSPILVARDLRRFLAEVQGQDQGGQDQGEQTPPAEPQEEPADAAPESLASSMTVEELLELLQAHAKDQGPSEPPAPAGQGFPQDF